MRAADAIPPLTRDRRASRSPYLIEWDARDETVQPRTGQAPAYTRASAGSYVDSRGFVRFAPYGRPRFSAPYGRMGLLVERASQNAARASEDLSNATYWARGGSVAVAAITGPGIAAHRLTDASTSAVGALTQGVALAAGFHALSLYWRAGTSAGSVVSLGSGIKALVAPGALGAPVVTTSAGRYLGAEPLADGWWRVLLGSTASVGAATHTLTLAPANTLAGSNAAVGTADLGGVQVELSPTPTSYMPSVAATLGTRAADSLILPIGWLPRDLSLYAEWARPAWAGIAHPSGQRTLADLGGLRAALYDAGTGSVTGYSLATAGKSSTAAGTYPAGTLGADVRAAARVVGAATDARAELETEAGGTVVGTASGAPHDPYAPAALGIGGRAAGTAGYELDGIIYRVAVAAGARSLAAMQHGGGR